MKNETWKPVPDYEGLYQISNTGQVKSLKRKKEHILKPVPNKNYGYLQVMLVDTQRHYKLHYVHRLVASVFIENPNGYKFVTHIDGDKENNCTENLRWIEKTVNRNQWTKSNGEPLEK